MIKFQDLDLKEKIVVLRCDFNVPIQNGVILDDSKIKESLPTINYLLEQDCKIVILSHLGKIRSEEDKLYNSLQPVALRLNELLKMPVIFSKQTRNMKLWETTHALKAKEILMLENTRFEDFPVKLESRNDTQLAMYWATLGDVFVNDAFGSSHRVHASTAGIAKYLPSGVGFLIQKEIENLDKYVMNAEAPFTVFMGGSKVEEKIELIEKLVPKCDYLLLGGKIANSFLQALDFNPGFSSDDTKPELLEKLRALMLSNKEKIMLPLDAVVSTSYDASVANYRLIDKIGNNDVISDAGSKTINKYAGAINESKTIFMNGTVGIYEDPRFSNGTRELLALMAKSDANVVVGGGDSVSAARKFGYADNFTYLSTGGGATLEYLIKGKLPALDYIGSYEASKEEKKEEPYEILDI